MTARKKKSGRKPPQRSPAAPAAGQPPPVELVPIEQLTPAPYNPRTIDAASLKALKASIEQFGNLGGMVWNKRTGHVIGGNQRLKVHRDRGDALVPVTVVDWPVAKEKRACLALNSEFVQGTWDREGLDALVPEVTADDEQAAADLRLDDLMADDLEAGLGGAGGNAEDAAPERWAVLVECPDESDQVAFIRRMQKEGRPCKAYVL